MRQESLDPLADLRQLGLAPVDLAVRPTVLRGVLLVQRGERIVESALLHRELQQDGAQLRHQRAGLVEAVGRTSLHRSPMVANPSPRAEALLAPPRRTPCRPAPHRDGACSWGDSEEAAHPTMTDEVIRRKVLEVAGSGAIPIVLGGDHSITFPAASAVAETIGPKRLGVVHFDAHADAANSTWGVLRSHGTPMRRLIESGMVQGRNFVQVGLRGYWPPADTLAWMREQGMRWHLMTEIESRGPEAVGADASAEARDGPEGTYPSFTIDVLDPGLAPGTGTPEPGGFLSREILRAIRRIVARVELAGMDIVEVSPPYDHAETTAMIANRAALEAISALAVKRSN